MALLVIGIGFIAVLTGAIAERFLAARVEEVAEEVEEAEADVRVELRAIAERLRTLERRLAQRGGVG